MKSLPTIQQRLGWKLFLSYLIIVVCVTLVLTGTAEFYAPAALLRHLERMQSAMGPDPTLALDLHQNFHKAVNEILAVGALVAFVIAVGVSFFTSRRIVGPIQAMTQASQRIAAGDYQERVQVPSQDELGTLAQSFNQMAQTLAQTEERRQQLIGDVAHELRTPLASIKSAMAALIDGVLPAEPETYLNIQRQVSRVQRLVHDLEELSLAEAGQLPLKRRVVAITELIHRAANYLEVQFEDKGVTLHIQPLKNATSKGLRRKEEPCQVSADPDRITQVLLNLLGNALHYTQEGGQVWVRAWCEQPNVLIAVQDSGVGIDHTHLAHLFERFYRVDKSRSRIGGGSGIGLTISKHLIEAHGGQIEAESKGLGQGSTFTVTLPLAGHFYDDKILSKI
jgi:histidine kinase